MKLFLCTDGSISYYDKYQSFIGWEGGRHINYAFYQIPDTSYAGRVWNSKPNYFIKK